MKVVINNCWCGGFRISPKAWKLYCDKKGYDIYFYGSHVGFYEDDVDRSGYQKINIFDDNINIYNYCIKMINEDTDDMALVQDSVYEEYNETQLCRHDPILIETIEELGIDVASGYECELKILEIPDGIDYDIYEYMGAETIHEKHRVWS